MRIQIASLLIMLTLVFTSSDMEALGSVYLAELAPMDSTRDNQNKKKERKEERLKLRHSHSRFGLKFGYVYAFLDTEVSFEFPFGNLSSTLGLEKNLGLPSNSFFFTGSFIYRITPRSGIYAQYYGINRSENSQTDRQYIFKHDIIPAGTDIKIYFNTQVISAGYLFSVLRDPNAYLGFYFNVYFMILETGVKSDQGSINANVEFVAPLPNFGIVASFKLIKWLYLDGGIGFFSLHTSTFGGSIHNFNLSLMARPVHWLGINLSYQEFDVRVEFPYDEINTIVDYNFRGPAIGLSFFF